MNKKIIYISCLPVLALFSACTDNSDDNHITEPSQYGKLSVKAGTTNGVEWYNFNNKAEITIYNTSNDLANTDAKLKGIYVYDKVNNKWINQPSDSYIGLWGDAIHLDKDRGNYYFTATSLNSEIANSSNNDITAERVVGLDQNVTGYEKYDLLVARSTIPEGNVPTVNYWTETGINLHFRHVLSRIKVNVYLPTGDETDGYFVGNSINNVTMALVKPRCKYKVTYDTSLKDSGIARISTNETNETANLSMLPAPNEQTTTIPGTQQTAKLYSFEAIIPDGQFYPEGSECLNIIVNYKGNNKTYIYAPPTSTIMQFKQEKITVVNLTLLFGKAQNKVLLNSVFLQDWITDEADVDLIPE